MKKLYLFLLFSLSIIINLQGQVFDWAKREGLYGYDYGYGIVTDNFGNVYTAGKYEENANFSGTIIPCSGNHDIYLAKYSPGGALSWIRTGGGTLGDYAQAMCTDGTNYVYVAGEIEGTGLITFPGSSITLNCVGDNDVFLLKYDLAGNLLWARSEGTWYNEKAQGVTLDNDGNVYITGKFTDTTRFGGTLIPGAGFKDMFIAKYDTNGNLLWMKHEGGPGREEGISVKCDAVGNAYVCGMYSDGAVFGGNTYSTVLTPSGHYYDAYLAKYSPNGTLLWLKSFGGDYDDVAWSLTADNNGKIYIAGEFNAYATFDSFYLTSMGKADIFVAALDPVTENFQWISQAGGPLLDRVRGIGTDGTNLFITGQYGGTAAFGLNSITAADSSDVFIAGMGNSGNFNWAMTVSGPADSFEPLGYESGNGVTALPSGEVYATGAILDGGVFGSTAYPKYSQTDIFIAKILQVGTNIPEVNGAGDFLIYPNPGNGIFSLDVRKLSDQKLEVTIQNCWGQIVDKRMNNPNSVLKLDLSAQQKGFYFVEIKTQDERIYREKIILQ
ncbi:MAG: hypothetical protein A3F72_07080 [Bacteroidetes bacterium RIFCSPLOWO2_12_FULL_35_15]|nr:MAG: hypothetical protein A3F72_07080 [Bacteroidetes bacterium RIFCSPLOWO2_12_FULL_35_15]